MDNLKLTATATNHAAVNTPMKMAPPIAAPTAAAKKKSLIKKVAPQWATKKMAPKTKGSQNVAAKKVAPVVNLTDSPEGERLGSMLGVQSHAKVGSGRALAQKKINYADEHIDEKEDRDFYCNDEEDSNSENECNN